MQILDRNIVYAIDAIFYHDSFRGIRAHFTGQSTNLQKLYLGLCVVLLAKKGWQNTQNKIFCDRKTFSRHVGFFTSRI